MLSLVAGLEHKALKIWPNYQRFSHCRTNNAFECTVYHNSCTSSNEKDNEYVYAIGLEHSCVSYP